MTYDPITVYFEPETGKKLRDSAKKNKRSLSNEIIWIVENHFKQ